MILRATLVAGLFLVAAAHADSSVPDGAQTIASDLRVHFVRREIDPKDRDKIAQVIASMKANSHITKLRIDGHTDARGAEDWNLRLSQAYADKVAHEIVAGGVSPLRIETVAFGESKPIDPGATPAAWAKNARVEFTVVEVDGKPVAHR
jgi:peptidoglycan-associated lipoprotein